jgi:hypothetical protein
MNRTGVETRLAEVMKVELDIIDRFGDDEAQLRARLAEKNWEGLHATIKHLETLSEQIASLEDSRIKAFEHMKERLGVGRETGFYRAVANLPPERRSPLAELYRRLKLATLKVKGLTMCFNDYVTSKTRLVNGFLEALVPNRRGTIYARNGLSREGATDSILISKHI